MSLVRASWLAVLILAAAGLASAPTPGRAQEAPALAVSPLPVDDEILLWILSGAGDHGLARPGDADLGARLASPSPEAVLIARQALVSRLLDHAIALSGRRLDPTAISREWSVRPLPRDIAGEFDRARRDGRLAGWFAALAPDDPRYRALTVERRRYQTMVEAGGWSAIDPGKPLSQEALDPASPPSPEARDPRVAALRDRLEAEGYQLAAVEDRSVFDAGLASALTLFQRRHGLAGDGVLGPATLAALNVPAAARLGQIDANLERWRWTGTPPADRVEVDIAAAGATLFRAGQPVMVMRAIVGAPRTRTPLFSARIEAVVFNPAWHVPAKIAFGEILPKAARDPGYLKRGGFTLSGGRLVQAPGEGNALGLIKFDLPNPFGVYLHDTSSRGLFARERRTLSHGCMRLQKPRELAVALLGGAWDEAAVDAAIAAGVTRRVPLGEPLPVFTTYHSTLPGEDGAVIFAPDVYGWDARLIPILQRLAQVDRAQGGVGGCH